MSDAHVPANAFGRGGVLEHSILLDSAERTIGTKFATKITKVLEETARDDISDVDRLKKIASSADLPTKGVLSGLTARGRETAELWQRVDQQHRRLQVTLFW